MDLSRDRLILELELPQLIFSTLKMEAICSSETSVDTRTTRRYIPEDGTLQIYLYLTAFVHKAGALYQEVIFQAHYLSGRRLMYCMFSAVGAICYRHAVESGRDLHVAYRV
jgi:hypothetical protein